MKTPQSWIEICLTVSPELCEACGSIIFEETGQGSFLEEGPEQGRDPVRLKAYLLRDDLFRKNLLKLKKGITRLHGHFPECPAPIWEQRLIFEENWQENWKRFFRPLRLCSGLTVCPTWEDYEARPGETVLWLDPGQAFGTGGHSSTRLCIKAMESLARDQAGGDFLFSRVLDVGTGSGILALVAASFQAGQVLAIDNDPLAVEAARGHVALNKLENRIQVELATPEETVGPFSLILANLTLNDLLPVGGTFKKLLVPGGVLVASGVLASQARALIRALALEKLGLERLDLEDEWAGIIFRAGT